jgi:hypothetical protein
MGRFISTGLQPGGAQAKSEGKPFKRFLLLMEARFTALKRGVNEILRR